MGQSVKKYHIVGAGFSGLSAACYLAKKGCSITILEKHKQPGGRARMMERQGFSFDMGPSWYWMPDVFEQFFADFGRDRSDYYALKQLDPGFRMFFGDSSLTVPADVEGLVRQFEAIEPGSGSKLKSFLADAKEKYEVSMGGFVDKLSHTPLEYMNWELLKSSLKLDLFSSLGGMVKKHFSDHRLRQLLEFSVLFLGASADDIPAMYNMMNHAGLSTGTFYPLGGMCEIPKAMARLAEELGVEICYNQEVAKIEINEQGMATGLVLQNNEHITTDGIIATADYHHVEQHLLPAKYRRYNERYWKQRVMSPSCLLFYIGLDKRIENLDHHTLFFDEALEVHSRSIYETKEWPEAPLFYVCCPSRTDTTVAPQGCENLFLLMPIAPGLPYDNTLIEHYYSIMMNRLERYCETDIQGYVIVREHYGVQDFQRDYHAYKGNAYGLANTLMQTAFLKPKMKSRVKNLIFAGQLTVPGPGVPPAIISGKIAANTLYDCTEN